MSGSLFAILSAILFALHAIFVRRAVIEVQDSSVGILISVPLSMPLLIPIVLLSGQFQNVFQFPWQSYIWLSTAGIFFFVAGRTLIYHCIQLVGANVTSILIRVSVLISVAIGIVFLHEPFKWQLLFGVLLIVFGITLTGLSPEMFRTSDDGFSKIPAKAVGLGLACGFVIGISFIFVRLGMKDSDAPVAGLLISYLAATVFLLCSLLNRNRRTAVSKISLKAAAFFFISGIVSMAANLARFSALSLSPASIVAPLVFTYPIFLLLFSFLINRKIEIINRVIVVGTVTVVIGSLLLF